MEPHTITGDTATGPRRGAVLEHLAAAGLADDPAIAPLVAELLRRAPADEDVPAPDDAVGIARGMLDVAAARTGPAGAVRVGTPTVAADGWACGASVVRTAAADGPFIVDSVTEALRAHGTDPAVVRHPVVGLERDDAGRVTRVAAADDAAPESLVHVELARVLRPEEIAEVEDALRGVLADVHLVTGAHEALRGRVLEAADAVRAAPAGPVDGPAGDPAEVAAFLHWLRDGNAVLLGSCDHRLGAGPPEPVPGTGTGLLDDASRADRVPVEGPTDELLDRLRAGALVDIGHTAAFSPVHRRVRMESVVVRVSGDADDGVLRRFVLLVATRARAVPPSETPLLRDVLRTILEGEALRPGSHDWKALVALFDGFPADELMAARPEDLRGVLVGLVRLPPGRVGLWARRTGDARAATVLVAVPRASYGPVVREALRDLVAERYGARTVAVEEVLGEGEHVRVHLVAHDAAGLRDPDAAQLEAEAMRLARSWEDRLRELLVEVAGEERGRVLAARWTPRLPGQYRAGVEPAAAASDVLALEALVVGSEDLHVALKHEASPGGHDLTRVAFLVRGGKVELSRAMPVLEHLGLHVVEERPVRLRASEELWIQDFGVLGPDGVALDLEECGERVAACIAAVWRGDAESDPLNRLVVQAGMRHERLEVLRAYRGYRARIGSRFTESFQNDVIVGHPQITERLVRLFELRFGGPVAATDGAPALEADPARPRDEAAEAALREEIVALLDDVPSLDQDRILRNQLLTIEATYRTNAYRPGRSALALKLRSAEVPALPSPAPAWEIFVLGRDVEGVHLRGGAISRGGLRWSDRMDYRTEVLGLMRAQMVKNAVIVPTGAKGGFLLRGADGLEGADLRERVRHAYVHFIEALLDVTDDLDDGEPVPPTGVRVLDASDPYLVVAADKGTATFSDLANEIAVRRGFWLGDAFASGGSAGYDHKVLGITARGAWESVKRHFRERGVDPEHDPITAVGIGDMSGDVFGNGMLLSKSMRLLAAYDHRHVFLDPDPQDPAASWAERRRLFGLERSSWDDYDRSLLSAGGGVWDRKRKRIPVSPEVREALGIEDEELASTELIRAILRAPVDLLWNGGIGTVVKASYERDADAEDRASDAIRIDARDLRARVVGEGGNLGLTPAARVEYARTGGAINADFIDNSAGVDCSDHEVNLKVLLQLAVRRGLLDAADRDGILEAATRDVVRHVLADSAAQARTITREERRSPARALSGAAELMEDLERTTGLVRAEHGLPTDEDLAERRAAGEGTTRPEIARLVALAKIRIAADLRDDPLLGDPVVEADVAEYVPAVVQEHAGGLIAEHPLYRELAATLAANAAVDAMGPAFVSRRRAEHGATTGDVVRALRVAVGAADADALWSRIDGLGDVEPETVWALRAEVDDLVRLTSRWHLRREARGAADDGRPLAETIDAHRDGMERVALLLATSRAGGGDAGARVGGGAFVARAVATGVPESLAARVSLCRSLVQAPGAVEVARATGREVEDVARGHLAAAPALGIDEIRAGIGRLVLPSRSERWVAQALGDDLTDAIALVVRRSLEERPDDDAPDAVRAWLEERAPGVQRLRGLLRDIDGAGAAVPVLAVRAIRGLAG